MKNSLFLSAFLLLACTKAATPGGEKPGEPDVPLPQAKSFTNPLLPSGADPWVWQKDGIYYYTHTAGNRIDLRATPHMEELAENAPVTIWRPPVGEVHSKQLWAPEIHFLDGKWYLYYAATYDSGTENSLDQNRRMFVLENSSASPMNDQWVFKGKVSDETDHWAIDGTVMEHKGKRYFIWSGWRTRDQKENTGRQQLYIAAMKNPWTLEGSRVMISEPTYAWEKNGLVNEGPEILKNPSGKLFLVYSCSGCWTDEYKLGVLTLKENGNPLQPADWVKHPEPLFVKDPSKGVYAPGHNGFFKSPDGCEEWIIYHANSNPGEGCGGKRSPRIQKFTWDANGFPLFGTPVPTGQPQAVPGAK